jgi:hypothetical protein
MKNFENRYTSREKVILSPVHLFDIILLPEMCSRNKLVLLLETYHGSM